MRENLTYGLMWRGVETRTSAPGATPRPYKLTVRLRHPQLIGKALCRTGGPCMATVRRSRALGGEQGARLLACSMAGRNGTIAALSPATHLRSGPSSWASEQDAIHRNHRAGLHGAGSALPNHGSVRTTDVACRIPCHEVEGHS